MQNVQQEYTLLLTAKSTVLKHYRPRQYMDTLFTASHKMSLRQYIELAQRFQEIM